MAFTLRVDIVSAESLIFSGSAERVFVPAEMGELGILPRHAPLITRLRPGLLRVEVTAGHEEYFFVTSGFVEVQPYVVTVLSDTVLRRKEMEEEAAAGARSGVGAEAKKTMSTAEYARLKADLELSLSLVRAIDEIRRRGQRK